MKLKISITDLFWSIFVSIFLYTGIFKSAPVFRSINQMIDLVLLLGVPLLLLSFWIIVARRYISMPLEQVLFFTGFILFCLWSVISYTFVGPNSDSTKKILQLVLIGGSSLVIIKSFFTDRNRIPSFLVLTVIFSVLFAYSEFRTHYMQSFQIVGAEEGYQWFSRFTFIGFLISLGYFFHFEHFGKKIILLSIMIILFSGMLLGGARQAVVGLLFVILYQLYLIPFSWKISSQKIKQTLFLSFIGIFLFFIFYIFFKSMFDSLLSTRGANRILSFLHVLQSLDINEILDLSSRGFLFREAFSNFIHNPLLGTGFGTFRQSSGLDFWSHPHNVFLEILSELGIIGFVLFIIMFIPVVFCLLDKKKITINPHVNVMSMIIVGYFAMMMSSGDLGTNRLLFPFVLIFLILYHNERKISKSNLGNFFR